MYGKVDKVVASSKPTFEFRPGHNKIDIRHTVGELKPDLILDVGTISDTYKSLADRVQSQTTIGGTCSTGPGPFLARCHISSVSWPAL